jgi:hypothetical protein
MHKVHLRWQWNIQWRKKWIILVKIERPGFQPPKPRINNHHSLCSETDRNQCDVILKSCSFRRNGPRYQANPMSIEYVGTRRICGTARFGHSQNYLLNRTVQGTNKLGNPNRVWAFLCQLRAKIVRFGFCLFRSSIIHANAVKIRISHCQITIYSLNSSEAKHS